MEAIIAYLNIVLTLNENFEVLLIACNCMVLSSNDDYASTFFDATRKINTDRTFSISWKHVTASLFHLTTTS